MAVIEPIPADDVNHVPVARHTIHALVGTWPADVGTTVVTGMLAAVVNHLEIEINLG